MRNESYNHAAMLAQMELARTQREANRKAERDSEAAWREAWSGYHASGREVTRPPSRYRKLSDPATGSRYIHVDVNEHGEVAAVLRGEDRSGHTIAVDFATVQGIVDRTREMAGERRIGAARRAAETRAARRERKVYEIAERLRVDGTLQPSGRCVLCRKVLTDAESIARGIGSECWQSVLDALTARAEGRPCAATASGD